VWGHGRAIFPEAQVTKGSLFPFGTLSSHKERARTSLPYPKLRSDENKGVGEDWTEALSWAGSNLLN
jgi:hypothetical protein